MSDTSDGVSLSGIVGVVTGRTDLEALPDRLDGVELRADLFDELEDALRALRTLAARFPVLFTLRLASQGGGHDGDDRARVGAFLTALQEGATLVDAEEGSAAAAQLADGGAPLVVSWHDFEGMPDSRQLASLTTRMEATGARAIKVVPTATCLHDAARMLEWVGERRPGAPARVGFAMGEKGLASRVLSIPHGAPWTYASIETGVAPGQASVTELAELYRVRELGPRPSVFGVIGNPVGHSLSPHMHNAALAKAGVDAVYLPLLLDSIDELEPCWRPLRIAGLSVTIPFKEVAFHRADASDDRSERCGASNTLVVEDSDDDARGTPRVRGHNTDFDGVLGPIRNRVGDLRDAPIAVLGNGGAARGAIQALLEAGARPTLHYRNPDRGRPVAEELGVPSAHLRELPASRFRVIINATSLGLDSDDPSPVAADVFDAGTIAFDMVYEPPETRFVRDAREHGANVILGREMLVAQGVVQFELFTGRKAESEDFDAAFLAGQRRRRG